ncbi:hypothetical protein F442_13950, partial [Phytophthora nicotianae P10297]
MELLLGMQITSGKCMQQHGSHNHLRSERLYQYYAENRRIKDPEVLRQIADMSAGADAKGILDYLRRNAGRFIFVANWSDVSRNCSLLCLFCFLGKKTQLRDVHNTLAKINRERRASTSDEQRTETLLREFCLISGNSAFCIQSARQKRLFRAFPEVILVDTTHCTNRNLYKGQYVHHSIFERETEANLLLSIGQFKKENPSWNN